MSKRPASKTVIFLLLLLLWTIHCGVRIVREIRADDRPIEGIAVVAGAPPRDSPLRNRVGNVIAIWALPAVALSLLAWIGKGKPAGQ